MKSYRKAEEKWNLQTFTELKTTKDRAGHVMELLQNYNVKGISIPRKYVLEALSFFEDVKRWHAGAAELAHSAGMKKRALWNWIRYPGSFEERKFEDARKYAARHGMTAELKKMAREAIPYMLSRQHPSSQNRHYNVGELAVIAGLPQVSIDNYVATQDYEDAAKVAERFGLEDQAEILYLKAAKKAERAGLWKVAQTYARKVADPKILREIGAKCDLEEMKYAEAHGNFAYALKIAKRWGLQERMRAYQVLMQQPQLKPA